MKIDRLIVCLNNNLTYTGFWNAFSPVWLNKFNLKPTLAFVGTQEELESLSLSTEYGDIIRLDPVPEVIVTRDRDWSVTWALFWAASRFPEEVCMLQGIDQMPLSNFFFDSIKDIDSEKYVIGFSEAYEDLSINRNYGYHPKHGQMYPTSHHVAKGKIFSKIYNIDPDWIQEIKKVFSCRSDYKLSYDLWGFDECYSSQLINDHKKKYGDSMFFNLRIFKSHYSLSHKLDRGFHVSGEDLIWDSEKLKNGHYTELHAPRPYAVYEKTLSKFIKELMEAEL